MLDKYSISTKRTSAPVPDGMAPERAALCTKEQISKHLFPNWKLYRKCMECGAEPTKACKTEDDEQAFFLCEGRRRL